jgi:hypothetical protein
VSQNLEPGSVSAAVGVTLGSSVVVGWLHSTSSPERPCVDYPGNPLGPLGARTTLVLSGDALVQAVTAGQGALLVFENGNPALPILIGLMQTPQATAFGELLATARMPGPPTPREARFDGERVVLEADREIVLKCGEASLTLRRDGRVLIRGAYVETHSKGVNRIKGGAVKIN